jgi:hypothetical protein
MFGTCTNCLVTEEDKGGFEVVFPFILLGNSSARLTSIGKFFSVNRRFKSIEPGVMV